MFILETLAALVVLYLIARVVLWGLTKIAENMWDV